MINSIVRKNLLIRPGYSPYCGSVHCTKNNPRTKYDVNAQQFTCTCGWISQFPKDFMIKYISFRIDSQICSKCGITVKENKSKYCGDGSDKDNAHNWTHPVDSVL